MTNQQEISIETTIQKKVVKKVKLIPPGEALYPYQKEGVKWLITKKRALLADEMGLGKTPQCIVSSNFWKPDKIVVICPAIVRSTWANEWKRWSLLKSHSVVLVANGKTKVSHASNVIIISYNLATTKKWKDFLSAYLAASQNSLLICDEAHALKSWKANRTRSIIKDITPHATRLLLVTGSPMLKSVADLHPLFATCDPKGSWGKYMDFCHKYSYPFSTPWGSGVEFRGTRNIPELKRKAEKFMLRRFKKDVLKQLPEKQFFNVHLDVPATAGSLEGDPATIEEIQSAIAAGADFSVPSTLAEQRQLLGISKVEPITQWIDNYLETSPDEKLVVFAHHKSVVAKLREYFQQKEILFSAITGETPHTERAKNIEAFQRGETQVIILSIHAAGVGITLTAASVCLFTELDWSPMIIAQAVDRLHRIGQEKNVQVYFLLGENTLDSQLINVIRSKLNDMKNVLGDK